MIVIFRISTCQCPATGTMAVTSDSESLALNLKSSFRNGDSWLKCRAAARAGPGSSHVPSQVKRTQSGSHGWLQLEVHWQPTVGFSSSSAVTYSESESGTPGRKVAAAKPRWPGRPFTERPPPRQLGLNWSAWLRLPVRRGKLRLSLRVSGSEARQWVATAPAAMRFEVWLRWPEAWARLKS